MKRPKPSPFPVFYEAFTRSLISPMQLATLYALFKTNNSSVARVAQFMDRAPSTARYHLKCLFEKGLVVRRRLNNDGRPYRVSPAFLGRYMGKVNPI